MKFYSQRGDLYFSVSLNRRFKFTWSRKPVKSYPSQGCRYGSALRGGPCAWEGREFSSQPTLGDYYHLTCSCKHTQIKTKISLWKSAIVYAQILNILETTPRIEPLKQLLGVRLPMPLLTVDVQPLAQGCHWLSQRKLEHLLSLTKPVPTLCLKKRDLARLSQSGGRRERAV